MRYVIYGPGAIGGTIGGRLFQHGHEVVLIARGAHLAALSENGLTLRSPGQSVTLKIPCAAHPAEIAFRPDDVVFLAMKSHQSQEALEALRHAAGDEVPVFCVQNGVANERMALRLFRRVYGVVVLLPSTHLEPGIVQTRGAAVAGILDAGKYPSGVDPLVERVTQDLSASSFSALADPNIMRHKYAKLLNNVTNSLEALCGDRNKLRDVVRMLIHEALRCYAAAGVDCAGREESEIRRKSVFDPGAVDEQRVGSSSWQSVARGTGSIEVDYLNGEIVLLGRLHGVSTPANLVIQRLANRLAHERGKPGSYPAEQLRQLIVEAGGVFEAALA